jgi:hypothetical protein
LCSGKGMAARKPSQSAMVGKVTSIWMTYQVLPCHEGSGSSTHAMVTITGMHAVMCSATSPNKYCPRLSHGCRSAAKHTLQMLVAVMLHFAEALASRPASPQAETLAHPLRRCVAGCWCWSGQLCCLHLAPIPAAAMWPPACSHTCRAGWQGRVTGVPGVALRQQHQKLPLGSQRRL